MQYNYQIYNKIHTCGKRQKFFLVQLTHRSPSLWSQPRMRLSEWTFPEYIFYQNWWIPTDISQKPVTKRTFPKSVFYIFFLFFHNFINFSTIFFHNFFSFFTILLIFLQFFFIFHNFIHFFTIFWRVLHDFFWITYPKILFRKCPFGNYFSGWVCPFR